MKKTAYKFIIYFNKSSILKVHDKLNSDIVIFCCSKDYLSFSTKEKFTFTDKSRLLHATLGVDS